MLGLLERVGMEGGGIVYYRKLLARGLSDKELIDYHNQLLRFTGLDKVIPRLIMRKQIEDEMERREIKWT